MRRQSDSAMEFDGDFYGPTHVVVADEAGLDYDALLE
jgi:hypothetical protein